MNIINKYKEWLIVGCGLTVSAFLQLITLNKWSVWHDEGYSIMLISYNLKEIIARTALDVHPPLYYLLLKGWSQLFGTSDIALRSFSVICALVAIFISYLLVKKLFNRRLAILTMPFLVLSPFIVRFGQEVRMYTLALVFIMGSTLLLSYLVSKKCQKILPWILYGFIMALAVYTHYFSSLVFIAHWWYVSVSWPKYSPKNITGFIKNLVKMPVGWWVALSSALLLFVAWLPIAYKQFTLVKGGFWIPPVSYQSPIDTFVRMIYFKPINNFGPEISLLVFIGMLLAILLVYKGYKLISKTQEKRNFGLLAFMFLVPMVILLTVSSLPFVSSVYEIRYFTLYSLALYSLFGVVAGLIWLKDRQNIVSLGLVGLLIFSLSIGVFIAEKDGNYHYMWGKQLTMKQLSSQIGANWGPNDVIVSNDLGNYFDIRHYNPTPNNVLLFAPNGFGKYGNSSLVYDQKDILIDDLQNLDNQFNRVWLVTWVDKTEELVPANWQAIKTITAGYSLVTLYQIK
jgi:hypothetical protein